MTAQDEEKVKAWLHELHKQDERLQKELHSLREEVKVLRQELEKPKAVASAPKQAEKKAVEKDDSSTKV